MSEKSYRIPEVFGCWCLFFNQVYSFLSAYYTEKGLSSKAELEWLDYDLFQTFWFISSPFFFFLKHPLVCFYLSTVPQFPSPKDSLLWVRRLRQGPASQDIHLRMAGPRSFWSLVQCPFYVAVVKTTQESISQLNTKGHVSWGMCLIFNSHSCSFDHCSPQSPQQKDTQDERKKQKGGRGKKLQELNL